MNNNLKPTDTKTEVTKAYRQVIMRKELVDAIENWIRNHPEAGYSSMDDLASEAVRLRYQELRQIYPSNFSSS